MFNVESVALFFNNYGVIILGIFVVLFALKFLRKKNTSKQGNTIFLLGECGSGKTSLLYYVPTIFNFFLKKNHFHKNFS